MNVIKHEAVHKNRISSHVHDDAIGAKIVFDSTIEHENRVIIENPSNKTSIQGYIHELGSHPFGYLLISQLQVDLIFNFILFNILIIQSACLYQLVAALN